MRPFLMLLHSISSGANDFNINLVFVKTTVLLQDCLKNSFKTLHVLALKILAADLVITAQLNFSDPELVFVKFWEIL